MIDDFLAGPHVQRALAAGLLASVACGVVGPLVLVKRITGVSGALSHGAFGGVGLGYLAGFDPLIGATGFALALGGAIGWAYRRLRQQLDALITLAWPLGMAIGVLLMVQRDGYAPELTSYLFGSILFVSSDQLWLIAGLDLLVVATVWATFHPLRAWCFDEEFAAVAGLPGARLLHILFALVALAVVALIQVVGVILGIALLTVPAAVARHWTRDLAPCMALACAVGAGVTTLGMLLAFWLDATTDLRAQAGPTIILVATLVYAISAVARRRVGDGIRQ